MNDLISKLKNMKDYENIREILGTEFGELFYKIIDDYEKMDKEVDILHDGIFELYNSKDNVEIINQT